MLYTDTRTHVGDLQECIRNVWGVCQEEAILSLNSGAILNMAHKAIEFTITAGGWPFEGAKETITALHKMGVPTFIASGDRSTKLEIMADHLGIPRDRVYGVATPSVKAQIVADLKNEYDHVVMIGDGSTISVPLKRPILPYLPCNKPRSSRGTLQGCRLRDQPGG